jgi:hypothetical protein
MSKIVVVARSVPKDRRFDAIARIREITGKAISEISRCLNSGEALVVEELFMNDHDEVAARLRRLVRELPALDVRFALSEVSTDYDGGELPEGDDEISIEVLENILHAHEEIRRRRQDEDFAGGSSSP